MPIPSNDDFRSRLRGVPQPQRSAPIINDFQQPKRRTFPNIGTTLPPRPARGTALTAEPANRPRQPLPRSASAEAAAPPSLAVPARQHLSKPLPAAPKKRRRLITKGRIALLLILIVLGVGGWVGAKFVLNIQKVFHGSLFSVLTTTKLKGEDTGRVTVLLAGNSADDPGHDGANLTDSIMVVSLDVKNNTAFMLSIPRDLWVDIPGYGHAKINEAYVDGEDSNFSAPGYANGGMGLLEEVVAQNLGLQANYYALIDYSALRDGVNAVGGVDVNIQSSDPRGLYDPSTDWTTHGPLVKLANGGRHLNGEQALDLARARGDAYGSYGFPMADFNRTQNQRMLILALRQKVLSAGTLANPIALSNLFDTLGKDVHTDLTLGDVRRFYDIGKTIKASDIQSVGLNNANGANLLANYTSPNGESALIPAAGLDDYSRIQAFVMRLTTADPIVRENATVVVLNGTSTGGLAAKSENLLTAKNVTVSAIGDAPTTATTSIIDNTHGAKPATLALLRTMFGKTVAKSNPYATAYDADFIVVLGNDWQPPVSTTASQ